MSAQLCIRKMMNKWKLPIYIIEYMKAPCHRENYSFKKAVEKKTRRMFGNGKKIILKFVQVSDIMDV